MSKQPKPQEHRDSSEMGTAPIGRILLKQSIPAGIGFLVMSINMLVDRIYVGHYVGTMGIGAIAVVLPVTFLISSIGMAIGVGGSSIIARALGAEDHDHADRTFGNQVSLTVVLALLFVLIGYEYDEQILAMFGAKEGIMPNAKVYFEILVIGVPFLAWAMMSNNVARAEGKPRVAMMVMAIPAILNLILDPIFIIYYDWGLAGAAWATSISYIASGLYILVFFLKGGSELRFKLSYLIPNPNIIREIAGLGGVTLARQGAFSVLVIVLNYVLFKYGKDSGETYIAIFGIMNSLMMFAYFPMIGITQGFMPIASFNYGAKDYDRVRKLIRTTFLYGSIVSISVFALLVLFKEDLIHLFSKDDFVLGETPRIVTILFLATPVVLIQLVGAAYFQAIGKVIPALLLTLTKQIFFLIPLLFILPHFYGMDGVWFAFPVADVLATAVTFIFMQRAVSKLKHDSEEQHKHDKKL